MDVTVPNAGQTSERPKILIADDDAEMTALLKALLVNHFECAIVKNGGAVLDHLRRNNTDLVLLDINMPGMNGLEVLRSIRRNGNYQHLRIAMLTGQTDAQCIKVAAALGANGYIIKPFAVNSLLQRVRAVLAIPRGTSLQHPDVQ